MNSGGRRGAEHWPAQCAARWGWGGRRQSLDVKGLVRVVRVLDLVGVVERKEA